MTFPHYSLFQNYFNSCEQKDIVPCLEDFIKTHFKAIKTKMDDKQSDLKARTSVSNNAVKKNGIKVKAKAAKAWSLFLQQQKDPHQYNLKQIAYATHREYDVDLTFSSSQRCFQVPPYNV
ncbi:hypothetical protein BD560DRAFT_446419 [Blakeslea trispora]|nr:hypothetical protein BD560DRAFT_446419 [Blakeslea trispora]